MKNRENILITDPLLSQYWSNRNPLKAENVYRGDQNKGIWNCPNNLDHTFKRCINKFLNGQSKCPYCQNIELLKGFNDLESKFPKLANEYSTNNTLNCGEIIFTSTKKVEWIGLHCGHEWIATVNSRTRLNNNCPYCSRNLVLEGFNDLLTTHPEASLYWDFKRNTLKITEVSRGSNKIVWWVNSKCGHSFQKPIKHHKLDDSQCPHCPRFYSHVDNFLERCLKDRNKIYLTKEWNYNKNIKHPSEVGAYSSYSVWWTCGVCTHEWRATVTNRFKGSGCPKCWRGKSNFEKTIDEYLKEVYGGNILRNKRPLTTPEGMKRELDFWLPELHVAFEVNDFATHSKNSDVELIDFKYKNFKATFKKGPLYHNEKLLLAKKFLDCDLFFIWEDEIASGEYKKNIDNVLKHYLV